MFTISAQDDLYPTYVLADTDSDSSVKIVPDRGAIVTSWRVNDRELLYLDRQRFADPNLSVRGGIPILFPICGNLPDHTYIYRDRTYTLKQHGFARDLPWEVTQSDTQGGASLTLVLESNDTTRAVYPFDFTVSFTYRLRAKELTIAQEYTNHSLVPMPFSTGLHPYFYTRDKDLLTFQIPSQSYRDQRTQEIHTFAGKFDFSTPEIDVGFTHLTSDTATVFDPQQGLELILIADADYRHLVFWTLAGQDFYCLEPWTAPRNSLNTEQDLLYLAPGETWKTNVKFIAQFFEKRVA
jgi:galactose mutarotase-like enzyme